MLKWKTAAKPHTHTHTHTHIYIYIYIYACESKSNPFFFCIGIITDNGTCIIRQNKADPLWITSLLPNIVTVSINSKSEFVLKNETHNILWNFEIQTDYRIPDGRSDIELINKKKRLYHMWLSSFPRPWLVVSPGINVFVYIYTGLLHGGLYFCLLTGR